MLLKHTALTNNYPVPPRLFQVQESKNMFNRQGSCAQEGLKVVKIITPICDF